MILSREDVIYEPDGSVRIKNTGELIGRAWLLEKALGTWRNKPTRRMWTGSREESVQELIDLWNESAERSKEKAGRNRPK